MKKIMNWEKGTKIAQLLLTIAVVYLGMQYLFPMVLPFLFAILFVRLLYPFAVKLENRYKMTKTVSRAIVYVLFLLILAAVAAGLLYLCYRLGSCCMKNMDSILCDAKSIFHTCCMRLEHMTGTSVENIQKILDTDVTKLTGNVMQYSKNAGCLAMGFFAKMFVSFIAAFLMLNDYERLAAGVKKTTAGKYVIQMSTHMKQAFGAYFKAQLFIIFLVTTICIIGLFLLRIPCAFGIGFAIGLCDALPFLGTGTVFVPWTLAAILLSEYRIAAGCFAIYLICSFIRQILEPRLVGKRLGVPPLFVLVSIYIGICVYGGKGVLLGPLSAFILYEVCHCSLREQ